ncbi:hypothetical protein [Paenibacillus amylolyticus]|uniref:hypothetical protein n=1 Tax=Paenibacillus amylolyticus TaxID=1451 RepID=UPI000FDB4D92|nr:hypothetical protein [Paenibacillus amylolyticus]
MKDHGFISSIDKFNNILIENGNFVKMFTITETNQREPDYAYLLATWELNSVEFFALRNEGSSYAVCGREQLGGTEAKIYLDKDSLDRKTKSLPLGKSANIIRQILEKRKTHTVDIHIKKHIDYSYLFDVKGL